MINNYKHCWGVIAKIKSIFPILIHQHSTCLMAHFNVHVPCTMTHCLKVDEQKLQHCGSTKLTLNHVKFNHIFIISFNTDVRNVTIKNLHIIFHIYQNTRNYALNRLNVSQVTTSCFSSSTFFFSSVVSSPVFWCVIRSSSWSRIAFWA